MKLLLTITNNQKTQAKRAVKLLAIKKVRAKGCKASDIRRGIGRLTMFIDMHIDNSKVYTLLR